MTTAIMSNNLSQKNQQAAVYLDKNSSGEEDDELNSKQSCSTPIRDDDSLNDQENEILMPPTTSLMEFEENEKRAAETTTSSTSTIANNSAPTSRLDDVISELRECFEVTDSGVEGNEEAPWLASSNNDDDTSDGDESSSSAAYHSELVRRVQCERQIEELNRSLCELRQQMALASEFERKRRNFARKIDSSLNKVNHNLQNLFSLN